MTATTITMQLRPYQEEAVQSLYDYFSRNDGNPLIVLPTGTGKSLTLSAFLKRAIEEWPETRVLVLTHVKELIQQDYAALMNIWPEAPAGIYSAGLNQRDIDAKILFAGIQSIHKHAYKVQRCDFVIIDEAHLLSDNNNSMYRNFLNELREINPRLKVIGFTATPFRLDSGLLYDSENSLFNDISYEASILDMINQGYLAPVVPKRTKTQLDVSNVGTRGGEFIPGQLEKAVDLDPINQAAVEEIIEWGKDRRSWLVFCSGVDHAHHIRDALRAHGATAETVVGSTPSAERARILEDFKSGKLRALTNANVLTTGFDAPGTDLIALLRPTKSTGLYVQMLGRGTRKAPNKTDCLVLDFANNVKLHGPLDLIKGGKKNKTEGGVAPTKECPECDSIVPASVRECPDCGYEFPRTVKIEEKAATDAILSTQIQPEWVKVTNVSYAYHAGKNGKPPSLRVNYQCGLLRHNEWICFQHPGYPREKAVKWWMRRTKAPAPTMITEALGRAYILDKPREILVRQSGKFFEVVNYRF